jgi:RNA polymerase subunit RPABC4/transcription elongation factor Spt4
MALITCAECNALISDKAKSCPKCGAPVSQKQTFNCFECGAELQKGTEVCPNCGAEQPKAASEQANTESPDSARRKKIIGWSIGALILIFVVTYLVARNKINTQETAKNDKENSVDNTTPVSSPVKRTAEDIRQETLTIEKKTPVNFLNVSATLDTKMRLLKKNSGMIKGTISSTATLASYKDIGLIFKFYSNTGALLDTKEYTVYEFIAPGESKDFEIKGFSPPDAKKIEVAVTSAAQN